MENKGKKVGVPGETPVGLSAHTPRPSGCGVTATIHHATLTERQVKNMLLDIALAPGISWKPL